MSAPRVRTSRRQIIVALVCGVLLVLAGFFVVLAGSGSIRAIGWMFVVIGGLCALANVALYMNMPSSGKSK
jgi:uncharacterized membrane protein